MTNIRYGFKITKFNMGKGDIKTKRGKIFNGTFGVRRPHKVTVVQATKPKKKKAATKKKAAK